MSTFTCPVCHGHCPTLRDLLVCHPRELRALTEALGKKPLEGIGLPALIARPPTPAVRRAAWLVLHPEAEAA